MMARTSINDMFLSLLTGIALLVTVRAAYALSVDYIPDAMLMDGGHPLARLAFARFLLFTILVAILALPLCWPLAKHAASKVLNTTVPGATCALALYLMFEFAQRWDPFPMWLDLACGSVLFAGLPLAAGFWWRRLARRN